MMKKLLTVGGALVVVVVIAGYFIFSNLDSFVKTAIEKYGSEATKTKVSLSGVHISVASGEGSLNGFKVGNPEGFAAPGSFDLGSISVKVDTKSVADSKGPIVINEIVIDKPQITYEILANGSSNLQTIAKNAQNYASEMSKKVSSDKAAASPTTEKTSNTERKVVIKNLVIQGGHIQISQPALKLPISTDLPTITLTNIGKDGQGATPAQIAQQVVGAISAKSMQVASADMAKQISAQYKDQLKGISSGSGKELGSKLKGLLGN